ncbi:MAG: chromate efflux transporter [Microscillaceae bacterium]|nr:chromate efflux transporter [Microscillaceae bacterium]
MQIKKIRYFIFLRDVAWLSITAFGGPQVHVAMFLDMFVKKRAYLSEKDFMELNALCQILPGPSSTQTIIALGFKIGGPSLAYLTLLVWALPSVVVMTALGVTFTYLNQRNISLEFMRFVQPMAVAVVCHAAFRIVRMVVTTKTGFVLMSLTVLAAYYFRSPWVFPLVVVASGSITALKFKEQPKEKDKKLKIEWANFILFWGVLITAAVLGAITRLLSIRLFENFYRNGSFIYGGGQVLIPVLLTEFVRFKKYLSEDEFLSGYGLAQLIPGPVFAFTAFIGALAMRDYGIPWQILGALIASTGIFLPGTFLIFFAIRFWEQLKKFRVVKASLEGIQAGSSGLVLAAAIFLFQPQSTEVINIIIIIATFLLLNFTKISLPLLIILGLLIGVGYEFLRTW